MMRNIPALENDGAPAPGLYKDVAFNTYASWNAINASTLVPYLQSAMHGKYAQDHPEVTTKSQSLGTAAHAAILEPERFSSCFVKKPAFPNPLRNSSKQAAINFIRQAEAAGQEVVTAAEWELAVGMREKVYSHTTVAEIFACPGLREVCLVWIDFEYGVKCKCRIDAMALWLGHSLIIDLKSIQDAQPQPCRNAAARFNYPLKLAWYRMGATALDPKEREAALIFVEQKPPHGVTLWHVEPKTMDRGHTEARICLDRYVKGLKTGVYPGYDTGMNMLELPKWAQTFTNEEA